MLFPLMRRAVKITGIGPVTPAGIGVCDFEEGIVKEISRIKPFRRLGSDLGSFVAGYIEDFEVDAFVPRSSLPKGIARHTMFAVAGTILALEDAGIKKSQLQDVGCVVVAGSSIMDFDGIGRTIEGVLSKGIKGAIPRTVYTSNSACIAATVSQVVGFNARSMTIQSSCCTGLDAVGYATRLVAEGEADLAICGGAEAPLYRTPLVELRSAGLTPSTTEMADCIDRPFDLWRSTGVVSEGACMFVIEPECSPRDGYALISGYSFANDPAAIECGGMRFAMRQALADACLRPSQIESISAWGPGHRIIDAAETRELREVFGSSLDGIPVSSIKGAIGNPLGAAPAIQIGAAALGIARGWIPPTVNWRFVDPSCRLSLSSRLRCIPHRNSLVNAHGLSGVNSSLVLENCK